MQSTQRLHLTLQLKSTQQTLIQILFMLNSQHIFVLQHNSNEKIVCPVHILRLEKGLVDRNVAFYFHLLNKSMQTKKCAANAIFRWTQI